MRHGLSSMALVVLLCLSAPAAGRESLPSHGPVLRDLPFNVPYGAPIDLRRAKALMAAAEAEARKLHWNMAIAVVDPNGDLVAFEKMDGTQLASISVAQNKARTAARFRRATAVFYDAIETGHPYVATLDPTLVAAPGGFPLIDGGKIIGAIGCSGGAGVQDAVVCKAAADTLH